MIEIACEACGWLAVTSQPAHQVWAEHVAACPAVGGAVRHVGALHVYRAAGIVVRCPDCDTVLMRIVESPERTWIDLQGVSSMQIASD